MSAILRRPMPRPEKEPETVRPSEGAPSPVRRGLGRALYVALGSLFVGLAAVGAALPLVPTTPFLLLASFFYARSSARLHQWLLTRPLFGAYLRQWREEGTVPRRAKALAVVLVLATLGSSLYAVEATWGRALLGLLLVVLVVFLLRLPSPPRAGRRGSDAAGGAPRR